jgi:hypothetical protein
MEKHYQVPFVARQRTPLPASDSAGPTHHYHPLHQLWVSAESGEPLVVGHVRSRRAPLASSEFGETSLTRTTEGADQSEGRIGQVSSSDTSLTAGRGKLLASQFGETLVTETSEGVDQSERTSHL